MPEHVAFGIPFPEPPELVGRFREAVTLIDQMLRQEETTFTGRYYQVTNGLMRPRPVQRPRPPLTLGAGAYLISTPGMTPPALLANLRHNDAVHETVLVVSVVTADQPRVHPGRRAEATDLGDGFHQVVLRYGFMEDQNVPAGLARVAGDLGVDLDALPYFLGRESLRVTARPGMARWREHLYAVLSRNATSRSERSFTRTGGQSGGSSSEVMAGSQYWRMRSPMGAPGPTLVSSSLS